MNIQWFYSWLGTYGIQPEWVSGVFVILLGLIFGKYVSGFVNRMLENLAKRTHSSVDDMLVGIFGKPLAVISYLIGIWGGLYIAGINPANLGVFYRFYKIIFILIAAYAIITGFKSFWLSYRIYVRRRGMTSAEKIIIPLGSRLVPLLIWFGATFVILSVLGVNVTPFLAGAGIVGLALALAAQTPLSNFFSGILLTVNRPFDVGHRVEVIGKYVGDVVDIGTFSTKIRTLDNNIIVVPNVQLTQTEVINHDLTDDRVKIQVPIGVAYGTDSEKVKKVLHKVISGIDGIVESPLESSTHLDAKAEAKTGIYFLGYGDFALNFMIIAWIKNTRMKFKILDEINTRIQKEFKKAGIQIPFPVRDVYLHKG
ncbi:MAG: mechanosensitive ion channel family protein [archaeon]